VTVIAWFKEASREDVERVGGKGANLGELTRGGFPVPPGFIITTKAYRQLLDRGGLHSAIEERLTGLSMTGMAAQTAAAEEIKLMIESAEVQLELREEIEAACGQLAGGPLAVRSSATAEDLADASFAGQQATLLNVRRENIVAAVRTCWASLFESQAIAYRAARDFVHLEAAMAVVVQEMVQAARSGVTFTVHPVTGDNSRMVIEAVYGLGEAIVSGIVTPDTYIVAKDTLAIEERDVNRQERKLVMNPTAEGDEPNSWVAVPANKAGGQKLTDTEIVALAALGNRIEAYYGSPQDIEWAEKNGTFFILQARPVTAGV
jgi:pyruvate,water dikinase